MEYRKLSELKELQGNPRKISATAFEALCESIAGNEQYFEARPLILSDRTGELVIIAGNQRFKAAKKLKLKTVPTYLLAGLTEEKEREIVIRDNVQAGDWDYDILANEWDTAALADWGVPIPAVGDPFSDPGIAIKNQYGVIVMCDDEAQQEQLFTRLQAEGLTCKVVVT